MRVIYIQVITVTSKSLFQLLDEFMPLVGVAQHRVYGATCYSGSLFTRGRVQLPIPHG